MGCPGCLPTQRELQQILESVKKEAKKHAVEQGKTFIIYNQPDGTFSYMERTAAQLAGITAVQYISHMQPTANG